MILSNADIEKHLQQELGKLPTDEEIFEAFFADLTISLFMAEQEAKIRKITDFPEIVGESTFIEVSKEIKKFVLENMAEYIDVHEITVNKIDFTKIVYWIGMYIFIHHNSNYGIKYILGHLSEEIFEETSVHVDQMMIDKIIRISQKGRKKFLRYYGRFGLYHSFKQIHKTLLATCPQKQG